VSWFGIEGVVNALLSRAVRSWVLLCPSWANKIVSIDGFLSGEGLRVYVFDFVAMSASFLRRCSVLGSACRPSVCLSGTCFGKRTPRGSSVGGFMCLTTFAVCVSLSRSVGGWGMSVHMLTWGMGPSKWFRSCY
jgi:hypothetical protein